MEMAAAVIPTFSVILPAGLGYDSVLAAIDAWQAQSRRDCIELLVLCPDATVRPEAAGWRADPIPVDSTGLLLHEARAAGVRKARGEWIVLAEDHCLPERDWVEQMLPQLQGEWAALGPALRPGNTGTQCAKASFLLGYGQWMAPVPAGQMDVLPGHNAVVRRDLLAAWGGDLEKELVVAAFLIQRLRREGHRFFLENKARMRHFDLSDWGRTLRIFGCVGMGFGAVRSAGWNPLLRLLYAALAPGVSVKHWWRAYGQYRRAGKAAGFSAGTLIACVPLAVSWACGESLGALFGVERVKPHIYFSEQKPVSREQAAAGV